MPDTLDSTGLTVKTISELTADLTTAFEAAYGSDINLDQNSPDGQITGIFAQEGEDLREMLVQVYNSFDPDNAFGVSLDARVALNGIARQAGTYTITNVTVTVGQAITLTGLDTAGPGNPVFTVQDNAGNQFQLIATHAFGGAGSAVLAFQAAAIGQVQVALNTITQQVTTVLGVTSVNNPTAPSTIGSNEETDAQLKVRRAKSFYLGANGPAAAVAAQLLNIPGMLDAFVAENTTGGTVNGVPAHGLWIIVNPGVVTASQIAQAIYSTRGPGCAMQGSQTFSVARPNSQTDLMKWDLALTQQLKVRFGVTAVSGLLPPNATIQAGVAAALIYKLNQIANIGQVVAAMLELVPNAYITSVAVSGDGGGTWGDTASPTDFQHYFTLASGDVTIL